MVTVPVTSTLSLSTVVVFMVVVLKVVK